MFTNIMMTSHRDYETSNYDEYDRHFTVMKFFEGGKHLREIGMNEFVPNFHEQYPREKWQHVVVSAAVESCKVF